MKLDIFDNATLLVTGGTGSFGHSFVRHALQESRLKKLIVLSRDEMKQWEMAQQFSDEDRLRFFIGDVRDKERVYRALSGVDFVVHAAATKIVPTAEYNPFECIKTNVMGAMNVIDASIDQGVKKVIALSTDKASSPINLYGASKLASDKLFIASNSSYSNVDQTRFSVVRYGNVMGSRGSVIPYFLNLKNDMELPITDERMTRFMITLEDSVKLVFLAFNDMVGGEIYVKKIPSMRIGDIAKAVNPKAKWRSVGIRPGEKLHEQMIGQEDALSTYEYEEYFKILPQINDWMNDKERIKDGHLVAENFTYSSETNDRWLSVEELKVWIKNNIDSLKK